MEKKNNLENLPNFGNNSGSRWHLNHGLLCPPILQLRMLNAQLLVCAAKNTGFSLPLVSILEL